MKIRFLVLVVVVSFFGTGLDLHAQEHPEHPEHPEKRASASEMTLDELADAISAYIKKDTELKGGSFLIRDQEQQKVLQLELVKIHEERLASLGKGVYFACTDMRSSDDVLYDLDFMMKRTEHGIEPTDVAIHKQAGKPRYAWKEENGVWKKTKVQ